MTSAASMADIDNIDHALIIASQAGLPLTPDPYKYLAEKLDISASEVMQRLQAMQERGIIRRIGLVPNHYTLGYTHNGMSVWDVPDERIHILGPKLGTLPFVSHCYRRPRYLPDWPYNLFAMVHGRSRAETDAQVAEILQLLGDEVRAYDVLYSTRILKKTGLRLTNNKG
ncbi:MAG: hypothetical protein WC965_07205 [Thiohalomonadaceae bacterium]